MGINVYIEQFDTYSDAYIIKPDKKVPLFLAKIGHELFTMLSLAKESQRTDMWCYTKNVTKKANEIIERYRFHLLRQAEIQWASKFIILLRNQAMKCNGRHVTGPTSCGNWTWWHPKTSISKWETYMTEIHWHVNHWRTRWKECFVSTRYINPKTGAWLLTNYTRLERTNITKGSHIIPRVDNFISVMVDIIVLNLITTALQRS